MKVAHSPEPAEERVVFRDGLGVRERRDTPAGESVEWFHLVADFSAAEALLRERVARLAKFQHVKFSRILGLEPSGKGTGPILVSSHVAGTRLAEVLEMAGHGLVAFDAGAGLHVTREILGGLAILHDSRTVSHGSLAPERVVLTPNGRVVMVEHVLGPAIDRLQRPRHQLWREWRIPTPPAAGQVRLDMQADLAQAGLVAIAALLGRPVDEEEYPHRLRGMLPLIQDRLSRSPAAGIAAEVVAWLERVAPLDSRRAFKSVREAQQAYEALVASSATAMGITSSRVKGVLSAVAALAPAPAAPAAPASAPVVPEAAAPTIVVGTPTPSPAPEAAADEPEIDIEALLRLEAELEGGSAPVPDPVTRAVDAARPPVGRTSSLEDLEKERLALQQQFASLVDAVAPPDPGPVHLIPETPLTTEPLVDERVRWSSMPGQDLSESQDVAAEPVAEPMAEASVVEAPPVPVADTPVDSPTVDDAAVFVEPIVVVPPEEPVPAAAIEGVPSDWWKEALPWRDEEPASPSAAGPDAERAAHEGDVAAVASEDDLAAALTSLEAEGASFIETQVDAAPDAHAPLDTAVQEEPEVAFTPEVVEDAPAVGADFGYLSLEAIEARSLRIADDRDEAFPMLLDASVVEPPSQDSEPAAPIESLAVDDAPETLVTDGSASFAFVGDEPATLEFSAEVLHDEPQGQDVAPVEVEAQFETPLAEVAIEPARSEAAQDIAPEPFAILDDAPAAAPSVDADETEQDPYARPSSSSLFGQLRSIMLQELEPDAGRDETAAEGATPLADAAPQQAASALFTRADVTEHAPDWRHAFVGADAPAAADGVRAWPDVVSPAAAEPEPAFATVDAEPEPLDTRDAEPAVAEPLWPDSPAIEPSVAQEEEPAPALQVAPEPVAEPELAEAAQDESPLSSLSDVDDVPPVVDVVAEEPAPAVVEAAAEPRDPDAVPEVVVVDEGVDRHAWDQLTSEQPEVPDAPEAPTAAAEIDEDDEAPTASASDASAGPATRRKRRRSRRKKGAPGDLPAPVVAAAAAAATAPVDVPVAAAAPSLTVAPGIPPGQRDPAEEAEDLRAVVAARTSSLLSREVPTWTPPSDLGVLRPRVVQPKASEFATPPPAPPPVVEEPEVAVREAGDDWGTGAFPATAMASGEVVIPARPAPQVKAPVAMPTPVPQAPVLEVSGAEGFRPFEEEIRPVGMPDVSELESRGGRSALTTTGESIGTTQGSGSRQAPAEPRSFPAPEPPATRGMNWRRLMAAAALIALFNGAAFAAWWWVQPGVRGTLVVETGRPGIEVLLDETLMGRTPFRGDVKPGRHTLRLRQGSTVRDMPVEITAGVVTTQAVDWPGNGAGRGALQVTSTPSGAELFVNGKARGKTPLLLEDLVEGDQQLMVRSEAGTVTTTATVVAGETTPVEVKVFAGWVLVDSEYEVDLLLNGKKIGASMDGQILLPPGPYRLKAENRSLGIDQPLVVTVEPGAVSRLSLKVSPAYYDAPEGTEVIVDGASVGTGPGRVTILPGTHDVVVRAADGSEKHFAGVVKANRSFEP